MLFSLVLLFSWLQRPCPVLLSQEACLQQGSARAGFGASLRATLLSPVCSSVPHVTLQPGQVLTVAAQSPSAPWGKRHENSPGRSTNRGGNAHFCSTFFSKMQNYLSGTEKLGCLQGNWGACSTSSIVFSWEKQKSGSPTSHLALHWGMGGCQDLPSV